MRGERLSCRLSGQKLMDKIRNLAELGNWDSVELGSHSAIRHGYENVLNASARLFSFATGNQPTTDGPISNQQEVLAADDLLTLAIHLRRLLDKTISLKRASQVETKVWRKGQSVRVPITRIINVIIHHLELEIIRTENILRIKAGKSTMDDFLIANRKNIDPICSIKSDKEQLLIFSIKDFIETVQKNLLVPIIELCEEHHLWLDEVI